MMDMIKIKTITNLSIKLDLNLFRIWKIHIQNIIKLFKNKNKQRMK